MTGRFSVRRGVLLLAIIGLGVVAAGDLDLRYAPDVTLPEARVRLALPPRLSLQPEDVARRWAVPMESGIRAVGGVEALAGEVSTSGLELTARFRPGTDVETKTARIQSELEPLRKALPERASLEIGAETSGAGTWLALSGEIQPELVRRIENELRSIPSVRVVNSFGSRRAATMVEVRADVASPDSIVRQVRAAVDELGRVRRLGDALGDGRELPVFVRSPAEVRDLRLATESGAIGIESIATIGAASTRRTSSGRYGGRPAVVIVVQRDAEVSIVEFDRQLQRRLESIRRALPPGATVDVIHDDAAPLWRLLTRFGAGFGLAAIVLALAGWSIGARHGFLAGLLALPLGLSIALNLVRLVGITLDVTTMPPLAAGLAVPAALVLVSSRAGRSIAWAGLVVACGLALPAVVAVAAGDLVTVLIEPARAFAVGMVSMAACLVLLPPIDIGDRGLGTSRPLRTTLRNSPTVLLVAATVCYAFLTLFGSALDPRKGSVAPDRGRIFVQVSLPEGTTLEQAEDAASRLETKIQSVEGAERIWGWVSPEQVWLVVDVASARRSEKEIVEMASEIRYRARVPSGQVVVRHGTAEQRGGSRSLELVPEADDEGRYALVLEGDDIDGLEAALVQVESASYGIAPWLTVAPEWGVRSLRFELRPASPASQEKARELATAIAARASPVSDARVGRDEVIVVRREGEPAEWSAPSRESLLDAPIPSGSGAVLASRHLVATEEVVAPRVTRQSGRFAVRVVISPGRMALEEWLDLRQKLDERLANLGFLSGAEVKRPEIRPFRLDRDEWRMASMAGAVPMAGVLIAVVWASSLWRFLPFVLPCVLGVAGTTPLLRLSGAGTDELTLLMIACGVLGAVAVSLACGDRLVNDRSVVANAYRAASSSFVPVVGGALACAAIFVASTAGTDPSRDPWVSGTRAAGVMALVALPAVAVVPPATFLGVAALRRRRTPEARAMRRPAAWSGYAPITIEVRHLTKRYRSGFRALSDVSFALQPGVVGLLGPNGAGKTTLLRILTGLLLPSRGRVLYRGHPVGPENIDAFREHIGFLPQSFNAYPGFTAEEFIDFWAIQAGITDRTKRADEVGLLIAAVGLEEHAGRKVRDFSGGMRQRIGIARALIGQPDLLVVDEPTTGLDIEGRSRFRGLMLSIAAHRVVVLSTHIAGDVEATCSRVLLLHRGRLRFDGTPDELIARAEGCVFEMTVGDRDVHEISARYRLTRRVRVLDGIRVKGVVPPGQPLPGPAAAPGLEEAYLAEIELADAAIGRTKTFAFLFGDDA